MDDSQRINKYDNIPDVTFDSNNDKMKKRTKSYG